MQTIDTCNLFCIIYLVQDMAEWSAVREKNRRKKYFFTGLLLEDFVKFPDTIFKKF